MPLTEVLYCRELPAQAGELIRRMKASSDIDMNNEWKVITVFIGGNDLCSHCTDRVSIITVSKKDGNDQESIQSSTTTDPGYHIGK